MDEDLYNRLMREIETEEQEPEKKKKKPASKAKKESASSAVVRNMYEKIPKKMLDEAVNPHFNSHKLKIPFRMCVVAPSGSGKTNFIINLLAMFSAAPGTFHTICVVTRNKNEPLYNWLQSLHDDIKIVEGLENTPVLDKMDKDLNHIVRQNCSYLVLLRLGGSNREVNMILSEAGLGVTKEGLLKLYDEAITNAPKFSVLLVDFESDPRERFRKGFNEILQAPTE